MEKHIEVERSIIKKYRKEIWKRFIAGINEYEMIKPGDKIAVCISGGKDSSVAAALCVEALGRDRVVGVLMPRGVQPDISDSQLLVDTLQIPYVEIDANEEMQQNPL